MKIIVSQKLTKCRRKIGNKMIFSSKIQEMTNCSRKIRALFVIKWCREGINMIGFDDWRTQSFVIVQFSWIFNFTLALFYFVRKIFERNSILQDQTFLQNVNNKKPKKKERSAKHQWERKWRLDFTHGSRKSLFFESRRWSSGAF